MERQSDREKERETERERQRERQRETQRQRETKECLCCDLISINNNEIFPIIRINLSVSCIVSRAGDLVLSSHLDSIHKATQASASLLKEQV